MTIEPYMIDVAVLVVFGAAVMALDIWLRRRKRVVRNNRLHADIKTVPCAQCGEPAAEWIGQTAQLCIDCCFQEYRDDRVQ